MVCSASLPSLYIFCSQRSLRRFFFLLRSCSLTSLEWWKEAFCFGVDRTSSSCTSCLVTMSGNIVSVASAYVERGVGERSPSIVFPAGIPRGCTRWELSSNVGRRPTQCDVDTYSLGPRPHDPRRPLDALDAASDAADAEPRTDEARTNRCR